MRRREASEIRCLGAATEYRRRITRVKIISENK
jgi:hypothetical protein